MIRELRANALTAVHENGLQNFPENPLSQSLTYRILKQLTFPKPE